MTDHTPKILNAKVESTRFRGHVTPWGNYVAKVQQRTPATRTARAQRDAVVGASIQQVHATHHGVYGVRKV